MKSQKTHMRAQEIDDLIAELDVLALRATAKDLGTAARIFYTAKEELVYWAVTMKCHETAQERFVNHHLYGTQAATLNRPVKQTRK